MLREREDVEHEHLEFHSIRLSLRAVIRRDARDLLPRDVERHRILHLARALEEGCGVEVVGDVCCAERERARLGVDLLRLLGRDFGVLHDAVLAFLARDDADTLGWVCLWDDLGAAFGLLGDAVADKDGVSDFDEAVVDAIGVDILDVACAEVVDDTWGIDVVCLLFERGAEGGVETAVTVGCNSDLSCGLQKNFPVCR